MGLLSSNPSLTWGTFISPSVRQVEDEFKIQLGTQQYLFDGSGPNVATESYWEISMIVPVPTGKMYLVVDSNYSPVVFQLFLVSQFS